MFDLKLKAPSGIRSEFRPIATSAAGIQICEHLPKMARWMHRAVVIRTAYHLGICHSNMPMYTGLDSARDEERRPTDPPSMGAVCSYYEQEVLKKQPGLLPRYVQVPCPLGWGSASQDTILLARLARETGIFPVFEAEHGEVTAVTRIRRRVPVLEYLKPQRRFAHLFGNPGHPEMLAMIQEEADRNIHRFGLLEASEA